MGGTGYGNPAGVKRDFEALERRRVEAIGLFEKSDLNQSEAARRLHVCRQTVSRWMDELREGGHKALQKAGRAGRKPELTQADLERLGNTSHQHRQSCSYGPSRKTCLEQMILFGFIDQFPPIPRRR